MASPAPRLETAAQTLAAVLPTAFVLVDRVRRGQGTPTDWSTSLWRGLAPSARQALTRLAPALDRGIGLREYLLAELPAGHAGHTEWPSLRGFLAGCPDRDLVALVDRAADAQIAWYRRALEPDPTIEALLDRADRRGRSIARVARIDAAVRLWGVADPVHLAAWVADPEWLRDELLTLLDGLWSAGVARTWRDRRIDVPTVATGGGAWAWVTQVTGLRPDADIAEALDRAERVVCSACPGLGNALSVTEVGGTAWVLYEPSQAIPDRRPEQRLEEQASDRWSDQGPARHPWRVRGFDLYTEADAEPDEPAAASRPAARPERPAGALAEASNQGLDHTASPDRTLTAGRTISPDRTARLATDSAPDLDAGGAIDPGATPDDRIRGDASRRAARRTTSDDGAPARPSAEPKGTPQVRRTEEEPAAGSASDVADLADLVDLVDLAATATALGDPTRIALLTAIGAGHRTAGRLAAELGISLSTVSRQIATLERAGLVRIQRVDGVRQHELARDAVRALCRALERQLG